MRPSLPQIGALLAIVALGTLVAPSIASGQIRFHGCGGPEPDVEPTELVLSCADADLRVEELAWSRWDRSGALATGFVSYPDCAPGVPDYKCQSYAHNPATLELSRPRFCRRYGSTVFTQAMLVNEGQLSPGTRKYVPLSYPCPDPPRRKFFLGAKFAASLMRNALGRDGRLGFAAGYNRQVKCNGRVSRDRVRCTMSWIAGDVYFEGRGMIWITYEGDSRRWNYAYRVTRRNAYCESVGDSNCTKVIVVR